MLLYPRCYIANEFLRCADRGSAIAEYTSDAGFTENRLKKHPSLKVSVLSGLVCQRALNDISPNQFSLMRNMCCVRFFLWGEQYCVEEYFHSFLE